MEKTRAEKRELEALRRQYNQRWSQPINPDVTSLYQDSVNHSRKTNIVQIRATSQTMIDPKHSATK
ncbi:hypothetical protein GcC1_004033 [Golovinomyces cichoracearum]|uniref:Uncharacterized protein n=1 Tax=Golovinomyces cichoracearum TaxID=62708 RepID=A0A420J8Y7_9PEZI|nr:hypothetical protein GcC1_004033 [Golovinomyces cichoracearum]